MIRPRPLLAALLSWVALPALAVGAADPQGKISPALARALAEAPDGRAEMLVVLLDQADLAPARAARGKVEKGRRAYQLLTAAATRSQRPLLDELERLGAPRRPFWIANFVGTEGDERLARRLAARPDVASVEANSELRVPEPVEETSELGPLGPDSSLAVEASLSQVGAPAVWALGFRGKGVVVGGQDTGVDWDHPALKPHYRGWSGVSASHAYNWHDAIHAADDPCGDAAAPCDDDGHGTHTVGTIVGDDGGANQIGVAPAAKWIACRNMQEGVGTVATYTECFQWFVAPTNLAGTNPDPARAPHVMNNSWSCPPDEGCTAANVLRTVVENTRAAGIVVVVSAGNSGPGCSTVSTPAAIYDASFTVGAINSSDAPASFSSRGPVTADGSNRLKPDLSAPGVTIRSAVPGVGYASLSGTSMAAPHVAGAVALLLSADPFLAGDVTTIEAILRDTADHPATSVQECGGIIANVFPNHTFGAGRIDALAAVQSLFAGGLIFRDNLELGGTGRWSIVHP